MVQPNHEEQKKGVLIYGDQRILYLLIILSYGVKKTPWEFGYTG